LNVVAHSGCWDTSWQNRVPVSSIKAVESARPKSTLDIADAFFAPHR